MAFYRERFGDVGLFENSLYPDIKATLAALKPRAKLFVATSKPHVFADRIIDHFGLRPYFEHVFGWVTHSRDVIAALGAEARAAA